MISRCPASSCCLQLRGLHRHNVCSVGESRVSILWSLASVIQCTSSWPAKMGPAVIDSSACWVRFEVLEGESVLGPPLKGWETSSVSAPSRRSIHGQREAGGPGLERGAVGHEGVYLPRESASRRRDLEAGLTPWGNETSALQWLVAQVRTDIRFRLRWGSRKRRLVWERSCRPMPLTRSSNDERLHAEA